MAKTPEPMAGAMEAEARAEQIALSRIDEAAAVPRPPTIGQTYLEMEHEALEIEQPDLFAASGIEASRAATVAAAGLAPSAAAAERLTVGHQTVVEAAERRYIEASDALASFRRRPLHAKTWHLTAKAAFLAGDIAGISGAAILLGEEPAIAVIMATSAAAATVAAGLSGTEVRDVRNRERRARPADQLSEVQKPFAHLFEAPDRGWSFVRALSYVSASVTGLIACAIFALRASVEDPLVGLVFGGIAAGIAAASWIESYMYADDIADLLANAEADYERVLARHQRLAGSATWRRREEANAEVDSITSEHSHRGVAARLHMKALAFGILRRNPQVVGHGPAPESTAVGQTIRRTGGGK